MKKTRSVVLGTLVLSVSLAATTAVATTVINTNPAWNGAQFVSSFGVPNTQTYGQVVVVPAGEKSLDSFSFQIQDLGTALPFRAEVYAWNGTMATGAALWESATVTTPGDSTFHTYTFTPPGGVPVTSGQAYVIFGTTSKDAQNTATARWGAVPNTTYAGGDFVFQNNGTNTASWTSSAWSLFGIDLAFTAAFSGAGIQDVPALSGSMLALLGAGLAVAGLGALRFRNG